MICDGCEELGHDECHDCQGQGWVLIPEAEQMRVLVRACETVEIHQVGKGFEIVVVVGDLMWGGYVDADTPEEALAAAFNQALCVE